MDSDLARQRAIEAEGLSASSPHRAIEIAEQARQFAKSDKDFLTLVIAERALGLARRELNELGTARRHLRTAIDIAEKQGLTSEAAVTRGRLAYVISLQGDTTSALTNLSEQSTTPKSADRAQLQVQRALVLQRAGRTEEALAQYRSAIPLLRRQANALDEARARSNRAVLYTYQGNYSAAAADLQRAEQLAPLTGDGFPLAKLHHNLGFVAARRGNVAEALTFYDQAQMEYATLDQPEGHLLADRCEALLSVGLAEEGLEAARRAVAEFERQGGALDLAEARLMAARAALLTGNYVSAIETARKSRSEFRKQSRPGWESLAEYVIARAGISMKSRAIADIAALADRLSLAGWHLPALDLRLAWAIQNLRGSRVETALEQLKLVSYCRHQKPALIKGHGWHAEALLRQSSGDTSGCRTALRAGLRVFDQYQAALGATELQVHAASNAKELAALGCKLALEEGTPTGVLEWSERWRAGALRNRPVRAPKDREVERLLGELRHVTDELQTAAFEGRPTGRHLQRLANLESAIRDSTRHAPGTTTARSSAQLTISELRRVLKNRSLVEFLSIDDQLHAVTVTPRRTRLFKLGTLSEVLSEADSLRFSYGRLARGRGTTTSALTFTAAAQHAAERLQSLLFGDLEEELGDGPIVVIPTGRLHHLPWAGLRSCMNRSVSVAPSAAVWVNAMNRRAARRSDRVVLVAGPGLPHAEIEVENLKAIYPGATVLTGKDATIDRVSKALDGARLAHVAAHGSFRSDNPLFSSLQLFDGNLTVYDLDLLQRAPEMLVLSACESGLNAVRPGDELLGLSAAVLSLGTKNLMASVVPVRDVTTATFMVAMHRHLANNESPPDALAHARDDTRSLGEAEQVTTAAFVSFGA